MRFKLLASALICVAAIWAQNPNQPAAQDPPPRVARLNLIQGQVSFQPATVNEWTAATLNYPVTIGDHLYADDASSAELHIGTTAVRLGPKSGLSFLNLNDRLAQIRLDQGALIVRVRYLEPDDVYEIDTAQGAISFVQPGEYRIDTDPDRNATMVTVRSGEAAVSTNGGNFSVPLHQTGYFGAEGQPQFQTENNNDTFDLWALEQDRADDRLPLAKYVPREMPGWQDLDRSGIWTQDPTYGPVWRPQTVDAGWAPYRYGHWAWVEPWGWTWIDDASWGFAPFHYGRWVMSGGNWVWVPGPMSPRPVYAPALVAFVGGRSFNLAVGMGAIAWFPLGPREVFVPAYAASPLYVSRINVATVNLTNGAVVNSEYMNQKVGITAVDQRAFVAAQSVRGARLTVPADATTRVEIVRTAAVVPQRASILAHAGAPTNVPHPPDSVTQRPVFAQHTPAPAAVPFVARRTALEAAPGRPVDPVTVNQLRTTAPAPAPAVKALPPAPVVNRPSYTPPPQTAAPKPVAANNTPSLPNEKETEAAAPKKPMTMGEKAAARREKREEERKKRQTQQNKEEK